MKFFQILPLACIALTAGCASQSYCVGKQRYDKAASVQPIETAEGLSLPQSPTALRVPPATAADEVPFGTVIKDPKNSLRDRAECLDQPPALPRTVKPTPSG